MAVVVVVAVIDRHHWLFHSRSRSRSRTRTHRRAQRCPHTALPPASRQCARHAYEQSVLARARKAMRGIRTSLIGFGCGHDWFCLSYR